MNFVHMLRRCEVFMGLGDDDLEKIAGLSSWRRTIYRVGEFIFHENAVAKDFYILEEGEINLVAAVHRGRTGEPALIRVDTITKGDVFGWSSLVTPHSLILSAICIRPSTVVAVDGAELGELFDRNHSLGYEVMKGLVRVIGVRLRYLQRTLAGKEGLPSLE